MADTPDLFGNGPAQPDMFADHVSQSSNLVDFPALARARLLKALAFARAAETMPWSDRDVRMWEVLFPQMAGWLPDEEADQLRFQFAQELERLKRAA